MKDGKIEHVDTAPYKEGDKEIKITKESFKAVIDGILSAASDDAKENPIFKFLEDKSQWFDTPEHVSVMVYHELDTIIEEVVKKHYNTKDWTIKAIFTNYGLFDCILHVLCEKLYGSACSVDKSRHIILSYIKYKAEGKVFELWEEGYWTPKSGTPYQWFNLVEGIHHLSYGRVDKFLQAYTEVLKAHEIHEARKAEFEHYASSLEKSNS